MEYTRDLVIRKAKQTFPNANINYIMESLDLYGQVDQETSRERVQLAILKLCEGDYDKFVKHIHHAKLDSRDILWPAEEPNLTAVARNLPKMSEEEIKKLQDLDRKQYQDWLNE